MTQIKDLAIVKTLADDNDWLIAQATTGETYRISKADLIPPQQTTDLSNLNEIYSLVGSDYLIIQQTDGLKKIKLSTFNLQDYFRWLFNETTGTVVNDASGNNRLGTYVNCALSADGVTFNGSTSRIYSNSSFTQFKPLSVKLSFKSSTPKACGLWEFRGTQDISSGTYNPTLRMDANGKLFVSGYPGTGATSTNSYTNDNWHTALAVIDASRVRLFVDKVKVADTNATLQENFTGYMTLGFSKANNGYFQGMMKDFTVWNRTLSDEQGVELS